MLLFVTGRAFADAPWHFQAPTDVSPRLGERVFHHLEAGSRRHLAVSADDVALAWEDHRSGEPRVYAAAKPRAASRFPPAVLLSEGPAYEPVIETLAAGRFVAGFEQDRAAWLRTLERGQPGPLFRLSENGGQVSLAVHDARIYAAYSRREGRRRRVYLATLEIGTQGWRLLHSLCVDPDPPPQDQLYPAVVATAKGVTVAWEDRRFGHTVLMIARSPDGKSFPLPTRLNGLSPRPATPYGKGTGVARVSLSARGEEAIAVWLDKRDFMTGHDVFAARSRDGGRSFAPDRRVQDEFGNQIAQWHAAAAVAATGESAVVWDDDRDGNADVWLAWPAGDGWSANLAVPGASGTGDQTHPVICLDEQGGLHLAWIERMSDTGGTRLRYLFGRGTGNPTN
jgi:hypothetical protein